ncbi:phosphoribosyltransferase [Mycolicibacterium sp. 018/SC-01/001]|uniref:phosphoribosyltransferase n=1 Tax=Mycolicibacterium sp. 018/SC-01/001 TaxID=2592069 RepID=UPI00210389D9|nr:phosphoribosyltransferase [Mycolicibacterium sp. 018/SC-01/001]
MIDNARPFRDRRTAGAVLARDLDGYREHPDTVVLGLARGGVPVGREVATRLRVPLEVCVVRKLGTPQWPELAMGAVATGGAVVLNDDVMGGLGLSDDQVREVVERETAELRRRERAYRGERAALDLAGRTVILVDDGIATGASMVAAARSVRGAGPARVIIGSPVGPRNVCRTLAAEADEVVCSIVPRDFRAVGQAYVDFHQMTDDEVRAALFSSWSRPRR